jgi:Ca2+-binding EF-hand superfamily protein
LQLVQSPSYNPNLLFDLISGRTEEISLQQMRDYMGDKVACNERELFEIFERFDWSRQGSISRHDFLNELVPFGRQVQSLNQSGGSLTAEIEGHFISLLIEILKRFRIVEVIRKQLKYIQPYDAFEQIDYHKKGIIGIPELRKLFFDNDFNVNDKQLYYLLHGLRRRCYRDVNLEVFC